MPNLVSDVHTSEEPHDRLTRLSAEMTLPLDREENADVKAMVFLDADGRGGIQLHGWEDQREALAVLVGHLEAIFESAGIQMSLIAIPNSPEGLDEHEG